MQSLPIMANGAIGRLAASGCHVSLFPAHTSPLTVAQAVALRRTLQDDDSAFYVVDFGQVVRQWLQWHQLLPRVEVFYAVKCNSDPQLLKLLASLGAGFDCASRNEIDQILSIDGMTPEKIVYANPCKTRGYIRHAMNCDVKMMTFDSVDELIKIKNIFPGAELILRIRLMSDVSAQCPLNVKFGCDPELVAPGLLTAAAEMGLNVVGISFHVGSGCRDASAYGQAISHARRLFDYGRAVGHQMTLLDIGGGYPGFPSNVITFEEIAVVVNNSLNEHFPIDYNVRVIAEPGRFFATSAYTLCCNVMAKHRVPASRITHDSGDDGVDGFMYYINDGVYGSFNCILYDHYQPEGKPLFNSQSSQTWASVWGPTCDGLDQVLEKCRFPLLQEGDWVVFENMGAYTCAAGSEFNGFPRPDVCYHVTEDAWDAVTPILCEEEKIRAASFESEWTLDQISLSSSIASSFCSLSSIASDM